MNERIKELAKQATTIEVLSGRGFDETQYTERFDREKFAELIVRECADVIAPMGDWCGGHGEPSMPSTRTCAKRLKEHFGVE